MFLPDTKVQNFIAIVSLPDQAQSESVYTLNICEGVLDWRIAGQHGGHVGGHDQEQEHFSPLGTKLHFHVNSARKNSILFTPNMAAQSRGCKPRIDTFSISRATIANNRPTKVKSVNELMELMGTQLTYSEIVPRILKQNPPF